MQAPARCRSRGRARLGFAVAAVVAALGGLTCRGGLDRPPPITAPSLLPTSDLPVATVQSGGDPGPTPAEAAEMQRPARSAGAPSVVRPRRGATTPASAGPALPLALAGAALAVAAVAPAPRRCLRWPRVDPPRRRTLFAAPRRAPPTLLTP